MSLKLGKKSEQAKKVQIRTITISICYSVVE